MNEHLMGTRGEFNMEIQCPGQASEIYLKLKTKFDDYQKQGKLSQVKDISFDDKTHQAMVSGTGFKSTIHCKDGKILVDLDLNFLLKPMRGQIEATIRKSIAKALA